MTHGFGREALTEYRDAAEYYAAQRGDLGEAFVAAVKASLSGIHRGQESQRRPPDFLQRIRIDDLHRVARLVPVGHVHEIADEMEAGQTGFLKRDVVVEDRLWRAAEFHKAGVAGGVLHRDGEGLGSLWIVVEVVAVVADLIDNDA